MKSNYYLPPIIQLRDKYLNINNDIIGHFDQYFEMVPAISDELKIEVYKLRYQVYCIENSFESPHQFLNKFESDDFDQHSVHYLIRHLRSGDYAATVRLILPDANQPEKLFPLEQHCKIENFTVMRSIDRKCLGEISRLCVSKAFRKRAHESNMLPAIGYDLQNPPSIEEKRTFPLISLALMACCIKASYENNIRYTYGTMEWSLLHFLSGLGIDFIKIGPLTNYHGPRWPTLINGAEMLSHLSKKNPDIWNFLTNRGSFLQTSPIIEIQPSPMVPGYKSRNAC